MSTRDTIINKLREAFLPESLDVADESHLHEGHAGHRPGGETHFRVYIVSPAFEGKSRIERHRMVNATLAAELAGSVHALAIKAQTYLFEAANVRHEHEYRIWESMKLPEGKILAPGVVSHATALIEHPDLVSERIQRFAIETEELSAANGMLTPTLKLKRGQFNEKYAAALESLYAPEPAPRASYIRELQPAAASKTGS